MPCFCFLVKPWLKKCEDDSETSNWIVSNTKVCPKCNSNIEKNGGCNRILCGKCRFQFCWSCMLSWSVHGYERRCNAYEEARGKKNTVSESRANLEKYMHYYTRYANHIESAKLDQELYSQTEENMEALQQSASFSWIEAQFLKEAVNTLVQCRNALKWTYALAYYLKPSNNKSLFEDNQQDLELATEALSGLLGEEINFDALPHLRQQVQDKARYVSRRREILVAFIIQGYSEGQWEYTIDIPENS